MDIEIISVDRQSGRKILAKEGVEVWGWVYLYILYNDSHQEPFGMMENLYVEEEHRNQGVGSKLMAAVIAEARKQGCYKLIGTSRHTNDKAPEFYKRFGFQNWGLEFRMDL